MSARQRRSPGRRARWALLAICCLLASMPAAARKDDGAGKSAKGDEAKRSGPIISYYATTIGRTETDHLITQYWSKGSLFRSQIIVSGHPIVTIVKGEMYYTYDALTQTGYAVRRSPETVRQDVTRKRPFANDLEEIREAGGEKVRTEQLNGIDVDVYRLTDSGGRKTLWVTTDHLELPIHLESYSRKTGRTGSLDWINWLPGLIISEAFFEPPAGIEFQRFDSYEDYITKLKKGPIPPTPPLFHRLLHHMEE